MSFEQEIGNVVWRVKDGIWGHPAIVMPQGYVYEGLPVKGEGLSPLVEFLALAGNSLRIQRFAPHQRSTHVARVRQELAKPKSWSVFNNCQDTVARIIEGSPRSYQREAIVGLSLIALLAAVICNR